MMKRLSVLVFFMLACSSYALRFADDKSSGVLTLCDGTTNVLSYRYGDQIQAGVDPKFTRSCYIHPLYSLDGEVLTEDFPKDHPHHRGVFWTWPLIKVRGQATQTWMPQDPPLRQQFVRWLQREAGETTAVFACANVWRLNGKEDVAKERVTVQVQPVAKDARAIDVELVLEAVGGPLELQGQQQEKKGYGGLCVRAAPLLKGVRLTTEGGPRTGDLMNEPHKWVDLSTSTCGLAILVHPSHPGFPPPLFARNSYTGFLNPTWPGLQSVVLKPGEPVTLRYRLLVHRGDVEAGRVSEAFEEYLKQAK